MDAEAMELKIAELNREDVRYTAIINKLVCYMFTRDIDKFEDVLEDELFNTDIDVLIEQVVVPFMEKVDLFSYEDTSAEVHLVVTAIRKKLILGIESITGMPRRPLAMLFLPRNEHYDLMLLYTTYAIKKQGYRTIYLGTNIAQPTLELLIAEKQPDAVFSYFPSGSRYNFGVYADTMESILPGTPLYIITATADVSTEAAHKSVRIKHYKELRGLLSEQMATL